MAEEEYSVEFGNSGEVYIWDNIDPDGGGEIKPSFLSVVDPDFNDGEVLVGGGGGTTADWEATGGGGTVGDVSGPGGGSTDNAIARWHEATGKILQDSGVVIDDDNEITEVADLSVKPINQGDGIHVTESDSATEAISIEGWESGGRIEVKRVGAISSQIEATGGDSYFNTKAGDGNVGVKTTTPTVDFSVAEKAGISALGGYCIKLTNETGFNTVQGEVVEVDPTNDDAVILQTGNSLFPIGVFLDSGIVDGAEAWIVHSGIALVRADAGGFIPGDRLMSSVTVGRADVDNTPSTANHFKELGHAVSTAAANGTGRAVVHFN